MAGWVRPAMIQGSFLAQKYPVVVDQPRPLPLRQVPVKPSSSMLPTDKTVYSPS